MNGDSAPIVGLCTVQVMHAPARLHVQADDYLDDLLRELELIELGRAVAPQPPVGLLRALAELLRRHRDPRAVARRQAEASLAAGKERVNIVLHLPAGAADDGDRFIDLLLRIQKECAAGRLLTLPAPPEVVAYERDWVGEVVRQLRGDALSQPQPFPAAEPLHAPGRDRLPAAAPPRSDRTPQATSVVDTALPEDPSAAALARRFVRDQLEADADTLDTATLCVSELVTNAVLHAGEGLRLVVALARGLVRIEVHDEAPALPTTQPHALDAATGRGLALVDAVADRWGVAPTEHGKCVWFELEQAPVRIV